MPALRKSYNHILNGRKIENGKSKQIILKECIDEMNELILKSLINIQNLKRIILICLCMKEDEENLFSKNFLKNITELNKNQNYFFRKILPNSIQKFLTFIFISFETNKNIFITLKNHDKEIKKLNTILFKKWLTDILKIPTNIYHSIIDEKYITEVFIDIKNKVTFGNDAFKNGRTGKNVTFYIQKPKLNIGLLLISENHGYTTPRVKNLIEEKFHNKTIPIQQHLPVNLKNLRYELINLILKTKSTSKNNSFIECLFKKLETSNTNIYSEINKIKEHCYSKIDNCDGVIIPGGDNIEPFFYNAIVKNELKIITSINPSSIRRTINEIFTIHRCVTKGIPLLGICRGLQIINVYFYGTLSNVADQKNNDLKLITVIQQDLARFKIFNNCLNINGLSLHEQKIHKLGHNLTVTSVDFSNHSVAKSIETKTGAPILGLQFHPEMLEPMYDGHDDIYRNHLIFEYFFKCCKIYNQKKNLHIHLARFFLKEVCLNQ